MAASGGAAFLIPARIMPHCIRRVTTPGGRVADIGSGNKTKMQVAAAEASCRRVSGPMAGPRPPAPQHCRLVLTRLAAFRPVSHGEDEMRSGRSAPRWRLARHLPAALLLSLAVAACSHGLPGTERFYLDGEAYDIASKGGPLPTVVFASDTGRTKGEWRPVFDAVSTANAAFAWDRPGLGGSASSLNPRDGTEIVGELEQLLAARDITGPLVLVGAGSGSLYMQLFARLHPQRVAGLVLIDPPDPADLRDLNAGKAAEASGLNSAGRAERAALPVTAEEVLAAPSLPPDKAVVIVMAAQGEDGTPPPAAAALKQLYPAADLRIVEGGPGLVAGNPDAVISAIQTVTDDARQGTGSAAAKGGSTP